MEKSIKQQLEQRVGELYDKAYMDGLHDCRHIADHCKDLNEYKEVLEAMIYNQQTDNDTKAANTKVLKKG